MFSHADCLVHRVRWQTNARGRAETDCSAHRLPADCLIHNSELLLDLSCTCNTTMNRWMRPASCGRATRLDALNKRDEWLLTQFVFIPRLCELQDAQTTHELMTQLRHWMPNLGCPSCQGNGMSQNGHDAQDGTHILNEIDVKLAIRFELTGATCI